MLPDDELNEAQRLACVGSWYWDVRADRIEWSPMIYTIWGLDPSQPPPDFEGLRRIYHPDSFARLTEAVQRALTERTPYAIEAEIVHASGESRWVIARGEPLMDAAGTVIALRGTAQDITELHQGQVALARSEMALQRLAQRYLLAVKSSQTGVWEWDVLTGELIWDVQMYDIYGVPPGQPVSYVDWANRVLEEDRIRVDPILQQAANLKVELSTRYRIRHPQRGIRQIEASCELVWEGGRVRRSIGVNRDVTEQQQAQTLLSEANSLREAVLEASPFSIIATELDGTIRVFNAAAERMLGYRREEMVGKATPAIIHDPVEVRQRARELSAQFETDIAPGFEVFIYKARRGIAEELEWTYLHKDGITRFPVNLAVTPIRDESRQITGYLGIAYDIAERKRREAHAWHIAHHDALTQLPNRTLLNERLGQAIEEAASRSSGLALMMIDLDHFKRVNDTLGHHVGDEMLKIVAARLRSCVGADDTVARMGGDEFVLLLPQNPDATAIQRIAEGVLQQLSAEIVIGGHTLQVTPSIGISQYPLHGRDGMSLIKHADVAMYQAKSAGRACYRLYEVAIQQRLAHRLQMESELGRALERGELELHYQPQICLRSGSIVGMEALIRWNHPLRGRVNPAEFIALAEETGLILPISEWILRTACRECLSIQQRTGQSLQLAVNLSPRQLQRGNLHNTLATVLRETGFDPAQLELEITEGVLMDNLKAASEILTEVRSLGVTIAIDDFGTGYSSLSYLTQMPIQTLKIDRSFVRKAQSSLRDSAVVQAIISMAQGLDMRVIAEGVETLDQLTYLIRRHCQVAQGFLFGPGVPANRFSAQGFHISKAIPYGEFIERFERMQTTAQSDVHHILH